VKRRLLAILLPVALVGGVALLAPSDRPAPDVFRPDATRVGDCTPGNTACYRQAFGNIAFREGTVAAFTTLREAMRVDRSIDGACHPITHAIGVAAFEREAGAVELALRDSDPLCQSGFAHAIVEREILVAEFADPASAARVLGPYCERDDLWPGALARSECLHGMGHGLLVARDGDLPFVLATCDAMTDALGYGWLRYCVLGAFMELAQPIASIERSYWRADDPLYPCTMLEERYAVTCYGQVAARLLREGVEPATAAARCLAIALPAGTIECLITLLLVTEPRIETAAEIGRICTAARPYAAACLTGYARGHRDRAPESPAVVANLCTGLAIDPAAGDYRSLARACARAIGYEYLALEPAGRCSSLSIAGLREACLAAAQAPEEAGSFIGSPTP